MPNLELNIKLCGDKLCATTLSSDPTEHDGPDSLTLDSTGSTLEVEIPIVPLTSAPSSNALFVEMYMQPSDVTFPVLCRAGTIDFTWEILGHPLVTPYSALGAFWIKITGETIDVCNFEGAKIVGTFVGTIASYTPSSIGGDIPTDGSDPLDVETTFDNTSDPQIQGDPMVVPGERISLWWKVGTHDEYQEVAHDYIHTCTLTGGRVTAVEGDYGSEDIAYSVSIEGTTYTGVRPSDFREYTVNEWVYILKPSESYVTLCDKEEGCKGNDYAGGGIIIPIHITGVSP